MSAAEDLSGRWQGIFNYPDDAAATSFSAKLTDAGGQLSGRIIEPNLFSPSLASIEAIIDGGREGTAVRFTKFYDDPAGNYDAVLYTGTLDVTGGEIAGRWDIPCVWSGTFIMVRDLPRALVEYEEAGTTVR